MTMKRGTIPSFVNGVSQQPPAVRFPSQVESQINGFSSLVRGLHKRPPSVYRSKLTGWPTTAAYYHTINRDSAERYKVAVTSGKVQVVDLAGTAKTVNYADVSRTSLSDSAAVGNGSSFTVVTPAGDTSMDVITSGGSASLDEWALFQQGAVGSSSAYQIFTTALTVVVSDTFVATVLVEESTTGAFGGEETTVATTTVPATLNVTSVSGRYYRVRVSAWTSGVINARISASDTWTGTILVQESTTGAFAGEETTAATITTLTTTAVTIVSGRYYRCRQSAYTAGSVNAVMQWADVSYITNADPKANFEMITVADHTFILNKTVTILNDTITRSADRLPEALVHVFQGAYDQDYTIRINGVVVARYQTGDGSTANEPFQLQTDRIAMALHGGGTSPNGFVNEPRPGGTVSANTDSGEVQEYLDNALTSTEWGIARYGNVLHIWNKLGNEFTISVDGPIAEDYLRVHKNTVDTFSDLPSRGPADFVIKVAGDRQTNFDDYYVKFEPDDGSSDTRGSWKETIKSNELIALDDLTMPHGLVRESDGTFTFKRFDWDDRAVGDIDLSPWPSFVNQTASGMVFHKNRIGIHAGEDVALSRAGGGFFNFFRETVTTQLDTDPIDIGLSHPKVSTIHHAIAHSEALLLFADQTQFSLLGDNTLTPKTVHSEPMSEYDVSTTVAPVLCGTQLFFLAQAEVPDGIASTEVREFIYEKDSGFKDGPSVTDHCPKYLPTNIDRMTAAPSLNSVALFSPDHTNRIYFYTFFKTKRGERLQSSWSYWDLGSGVEILNGDFIRNELVMLVKRGSDVFIEGIPCGDGFSDGGEVMFVCLDRRLNSADCSPSYSAGNDETTFTVPYDPTNCVAGTIDAVNIPIVSRTSTTIVVAGDYSATTLFFGENYSYNVIPSEIVPKTQPPGEEKPLAIVDGHLTLTYVTYSAMPYFRVVVSRGYRNSYTKEYTGAALGENVNIIGNYTEVWRPVKVSIMAPTAEVQMEIIGDNMFPAAILSAQWYGSIFKHGVL